jgi:DNA-binding transcriptional MerR regulator
MMNEQGDTFRKTYSLSEIGELIGRPATTVTTWKNQFREFLPSIGSGRNKRYTEESLNLFQLIEKMKDANEPLEMIRARLRETAREIIVEDVSNDSKPPLMQGLLESYTSILSFMEQQHEDLEEIKNEQRIEMQSLKKANEQLTKQNEALHSKLNDIDERMNERDKKLMESIRELQKTRQLTEVAATKEDRSYPGFFRRLFGGK